MRKKARSKKEGKKVAVERSSERDGNNAAGLYNCPSLSTPESPLSSLLQSIIFPARWTRPSFTPQTTRKLFSFRPRE